MGAGTSENKNILPEISEECKQEYFKIIKKDFSTDMKKIHSTIHRRGTNIGVSENDWIHCLMDRFNEYTQKNAQNNSYLKKVNYYLQNLEESNEAKHIINLSVFLAKEMEDKQKFLETLATEEEFETTNPDAFENISKDEMLWKGSEFIFMGLEDVNHPIYGFITNLSFILSEIYEKEYYKRIQQDSSIASTSRSHEGSEILSSPSHLERHKTAPDESIPRSGSSSPYFKEHKSPPILPTSLLPLHTIGTFHYSHVNKKIEVLYKAIQTEISSFAEYIAEAIMRFYSIRNTASPKLFEMFCEKAKDLMVRKDLYKILYQIKSTINHAKKNTYQSGIIKYYNIKPYYLCTNPYFCLEVNYRIFIQDILKEKRNKRRESLNKLKSQISNLQEKETNLIHFGKSIRLMRELIESDSIWKKIDIMFQIRGSVLSEIDAFWKEIPLQNKYKSVDADNLQSIFIYLLIKSQISTLVIDLDIIDDFITRSQKQSRKGYFFSLFQSSMEYIISNISMNQLEKNVKDYNSFILKEAEALAHSPESILDIKKIYPNRREITHVEEDST